jgi:hypothetical protein
LIFNELIPMDEVQDSSAIARRKWIAREWLWLLFCVGPPAALFVVSDLGGYARPSSDQFLFWADLLTVYVIANVLRITVWAIRTVARKPKPTSTNF